MRAQMHSVRVSERQAAECKFDFQLISGIDLLLGHSGEVIGIVKLHEQFLLQLMADFVFIQVRNMFRPRL